MAARRNDTAEHGDRFERANGAIGRSDFPAADCPMLNTDLATPCSARFFARYRTRHEKRITPPSLGLSGSASSHRTTNEPDVFDSVKNFASRLHWALS